MVAILITNHPNPSKPRRRWFQYSLRTLFVLVTVLCIFCVWLGSKMERARKQREAVEAIEELADTVWYDYQFDSSGNSLGNAKPPGPKWLRELIGDEYFVSVHVVLIRNAQVTDADLVHLNGLTNLEFLFLTNTQVTDEGVKKLQQALPNCKISH